MAGWSNPTQPQLRALLQSHGQPTDGSKSALVQRLTAFVSDDSEAASDKVESEEAAVKVAAATARAALHPHRIRHNEQTCQLLQLVGQEDLHPTFMRAEVWGVVGLWRLRGVCRAFRGWAMSMLSSLPRVVAMGGMVVDRSVNPPKWHATASVESLDLSTMRWSAAGCMPSLPDPRAGHSVSSCADGRVAVCGGYNYGGYNEGGADNMNHLRRTALQWLPGTGTWSALRDLPAGRTGAASVGLPDGRTMLIGGISDGQALASVVVLTADDSGCTDLAPLVGGCAYPAAALLPDGKVLVAGGKSGRSPDAALNIAELWDPATQKWTVLPPMAHKRSHPAACVLPSGRVAVVGGFGTDGEVRKDGEVFDPVKREWEPLRVEMAHQHSDISTVAVAGGLLAVGGVHTPELYDEESGRWFTLPHAMEQRRQGTGLVSVPAAVLVAAAALQQQRHEREQSEQDRQHQQYQQEQWGQEQEQEQEQQEQQ
eukprot:COSAG06_NODE_9677_length_1846_cov_1.724671_1_plen_482_part_10